MSTFQIPVEYLGGHPDLDGRSAEGVLVLADDSAVLSFHEAKASPNPLELTRELTERFVVPIADVDGFRLDRGSPVDALKVAARGSIFLGAYGAASALDSHLGAVLTLSAHVADRPTRIAFLVREADVAALVARIDGRR